MKFFTLHTPIRHFFARYLEEKGLFASNPAEAEYLVLPFMYEVIYDYNQQKLQELGVDDKALDKLKETAVILDRLSVEWNKNLVVFFYRDPTHELPFQNALIFRTSGFANSSSPRTYSLPAFIDGKPGNPEVRFRFRQEVPSVSFRGNAAPVRLPLSIALRDQANRLLAAAGSAKRVKNYQPEGYLLRRRAILSCLRAKNRISGNFLLNPPATGPGYKQDYLKSFHTSDYVICSAGFGNYSYRLYETMREGRIPVYIDTDTLLPCSDRIDWKKLMVWVPAAEVDRAAQYILDFHHSIHPDDFIELQHNIRETYLHFLTWPGFSSYLANDFLPGLILSLGEVPAASRV